MTGLTKALCSRFFKNERTEETGVVVLARLWNEVLWDLRRQLEEQAFLSAALCTTCYSACRQDAGNIDRANACKKRIITTTMALTSRARGV